MSVTRARLIVVAVLAGAQAAQPAAAERDSGTAQSAVVTLLSRTLAAQERGEIDLSSVAPDGFTWGTGPRDVFTSRAS